MSIGTLWTTDLQPASKGIQAAAVLGGLEMDRPEGYVHFETNKTEPFLEKFPHGKIPAFEGKDGFRLTESGPIARYIASLAPNARLLGSSPQDAALVDQWMHFVDTELQPNNQIVTQMLRGSIQPYNKALDGVFRQRQLRALTTLHNHLETCTFLVGERMTLADVHAAGMVLHTAANVFDKALRAKVPNVVRWFETVINHPQLIPIYGDFVWLEEAKQYVAPKKEEKLKATAPAPKAEKKPKAAEPEDDEEEKTVEEPKAKNPLDSLPKSSFNLEDWKRAYSNMDARGSGGSLEWFYSKFDPEGFSIWQVTFKYNEELTQVFMSSNQIGGFFNRLEASRKYLFGSIGVLGTANNSFIAGTLICRGKDIKPVVEVAPDWESYEFKPIDLNDASQKAFFEGALAWDLEVDGKKWADGKNFK